MPERPGIGVDAQGGAVVDPTANVIALNEAANKRQDDLRMAAKELADAKIAHQKEISDLRALHQNAMAELREQHQDRMAEAEAGRLNSIRQVDREEVVKTAGSANTAIAALAKQTSDLATTLAKQVADTAVAAEARNTTQYSDTNKRLSALELSSSEGKGKQGVFDPQMEKLTALVEVLSRNQSAAVGKSTGISLAWGLLLGVVSLVSMLLGIGGVMYALLKP